MPPTGVVHADEAATALFCPPSAVLCGYPWPPPAGALYRFDTPEMGVYRVSLEYPATVTKLPPMPPWVERVGTCTGATDDDVADAEYWGQTSTHLSLHEMDAVYLP